MRNLRNNNWYGEWLMSDGTIHSIFPFMLQGFISTPHFLKLGSNFMPRWWMDCLLAFIRWCHLWKNEQKFLKKWRYTWWQVAHLSLTWISTIRRPKCQVSFTLFQTSLSLHTLLRLSNFNFFLMFLLFVVDTWWTTYGGKVPNLQKLVIYVLIQTCSSSECERNWSVLQKIHTKKSSKLKNSTLFFEFIRNSNLLFL